MLTDTQGTSKRYVPQYSLRRLSLLTYPKESYFAARTASTIRASHPAAISPTIAASSIRANA